MSFGRWLLVNSFSIFILCLVFFGYIYRSELQLERAYNQLFKHDIKTEIALPFSDSKAKKLEDAINTDISKKFSPPETVEKSSEEIEKLEIETIPTVSTDTTPSLKFDVTKNTSMSQEERLYMARQAYWDKNYADSISLYQQLIQENRGNPDYPGELGNIYYSLNDGEKASRLYFQAAMIYINHNQPDRARLLVAPIIALNRELGEKLKFRLK